MSQLFLPEAARSTISEDLAREAWAIAQALEQLEPDEPALDRDEVVMDDRAARPGT